MHACFARCATPRHITFSFKLACLFVAVSYSGVGLNCRLHSGLTFADNVRFIFPEQKICKKLQNDAKSKLRLKEPLTIKKENDCLQSSSDLVHQLEEEELAQQSIFFHCLEEQTQKRKWSFNIERTNIWSEFRSCIGWDLK
ncbi:hypothetical protein YC2023_007310 [Brassica napus]